MLVHDLRSPLRAIVDYPDRLRLSDPNREDQSLLRPALTRARHMSGLIATILYDEATATMRVERTDQITALEIVHSIKHPVSSRPTYCST